MIRDLITLSAYALFFTILYILFVDRRREGQFLAAGTLFAWLSPIIDEVYETLISKRSRKWNKVRISVVFKIILIV